MTKRFFQLLMHLALAVVFSSVPLLAYEARAGRAPVIPRITSADQRGPWVKIIVQRDYIGQRLGWSIKGGEKVLYQVTGDIHPWVNEAFIKALRELGCYVDVIIRDQPKVSHDDWYKQIPGMMEE